GIGIASGRQLTDQDRANTEPVAVVSESLAGQYWHGESPIGACIRLPDANATCVRVVGVAQDVRFAQLQGAPRDRISVDTRASGVQTCALPILASASLLAGN